MPELWSFSFFRYTVGVSVVLSVLFALVSCIIVARRLTFLAIGTEHAAFGAVGLAQVLNTPVFPTTVIFCMLITVFAGRMYKKNSDLGTNLLFSAAMAFGMIALSISKRQSFNLMNFLFGDLIGVTREYFIFALVVAVIILLILTPAFGKIVYLSFDFDSAVVSGVKVGFWDTIVYIALALSIIIGIQLVGVLLIAAMSVLPAAFALLWKKNMNATLLIAFLFNLASMFLGIFMSVIFDVAPGALIVLNALLLYFISKILLKYAY
ncbi:MAG: metal ABC transporter permease [Brevinemataceae bacterium]